VAELVTFPVATREVVTLDVVAPSDVDGLVVGTVWVFVAVVVVSVSVVVVSVLVLLVDTAVVAAAVAAESSSTESDLIMDLKKSDGIASEIKRMMNDDQVRHNVDGIQGKFKVTVGWQYEELNDGIWQWVWTH
jgi:hypothetical protein